MRAYRAALNKWFLPPLKTRPLGPHHTADVDEAYACHTLRHSYGTALAAQGVPMRTLQEWMGHKNIQTTQRYAD